MSLSDSVAQEAWCSLDFPRQHDRLHLQLFFELIYKIDFPFEPFQLPCSQAEGEERDCANDNHRRRDP